MSYQDVRAFLRQNGLAGREMLLKDSIDTVEHAVAAIGCREAGQIMKSLSFLTDGGPVMVCMAGDARISNPKYKAYFHQKASMIPFDQVEALTGHAPGGVCPFGLKEGVKVYLDVSLRRYDKVYSAEGDDHSAIPFSPDELDRYVKPVAWIDVCKDWRGLPSR